MGLTRSWLHNRLKPGGQMHAAVLRLTRLEAQPQLVVGPGGNRHGLSELP
jgi:hypothetical protein